MGFYLLIRVFDMSFLEEMKKIHDNSLNEKYETFKVLMRNEMKANPSNKIFMAYKQKCYDFSSDEMRNFIKTMLVKDGFKVNDVFEPSGINIYIGDVCG